VRTIGQCNFIVIATKNLCTMMMICLDTIIVIFLSRSHYPGLQTCRSPLHQRELTRMMTNEGELRSKTGNIIVAVSTVIMVLVTGTCTTV
jgi:hypothetical protein